MGIEDNIKIEYKEYSLLDVYKLYLDKRLVLPKNYNKDDYFNKFNYLLYLFNNKPTELFSIYQRDDNVLEILDGKKRMKIIFELFFSFDLFDHLCRNITIKDIDSMNQFSDYILSNVRIILLTIKGNGGSINNFGWGEYKNDKI